MQTLKRLLVNDAISTTGNNVSNLTYDLFKVTSSNEALREAAEAVLPKLPVDISVIVAPGLGAAAFAYALALLMPTPVQVLTLRDPAKSRGGETLVQGLIPIVPSNAVFVDDIIITGATYRQALDLLRKYAPTVQVVCCACVLNAWLPHGSRLIHASGTPVYAAVRRHDIGLTRDCSSSARSGPKIEALADKLLSFKIHNLDKTRQKSIPLLLADRIITADDSHTVRCTSLTGAPIWQWRPARTQVKGIVQDLELQIDNTIIVACYAGMVVKLNATTGSCIWSTDVASSIHATPVIDHTTGDIYVVGEEFNVTTHAPGGSITKLSADGSKIQYCRFSEQFAPARCSFVEDRVIVTANDGVLRCFIKNLLAPSLWSMPLPGLARGAVLPVKGLLVVATESGHVLAVNAATGVTVWARHVSKAFKGTVPVSYGDLVIVCDTTGFVHGFNYATGERVWVARLRSAVRQRPTPLQARQWLFAGINGDVSLLDPATGEKLAQTQTGLHQLLQPGSVHNGRYALFGSDGTVEVFKCHDMRSR